MTVAQFWETVYLPQMEKEKTPSTIRSYKLYWGGYLRDHFKHTKTLRGYEAYSATNFLGLCGRCFAPNCCFRWIAYLCGTANQSTHLSSLAAEGSWKVLDPKVHLTAEHFSRIRWHPCHLCCPQRIRYK